MRDLGQAIIFLGPKSSVSRRTGQSIPISPNKKLLEKKGLNMTEKDLHAVVSDDQLLSLEDNSALDEFVSLWVFVYKTDNHGFLVKCKTRLVVGGNQQKIGDLPTRATTLVGNTLRTLLAIAQIRLRAQPTRRGKCVRQVRP
jgi:hypothetical protein